MDVSKEVKKSNNPKTMMVLILLIILLIIFFALLIYFIYSLITGGNPGVSASAPLSNIILVAFYTTISKLYYL